MGNNYISKKVEVNNKLFSNKLFNNESSKLSKIKEEEEKADDVNNGRSSDSLQKGKREFTSSYLSHKKAKHRIGVDTSTLLNMGKTTITSNTGKGSFLSTQNPQTTGPRRTTNI